MTRETTLLRLLLTFALLALATISRAQIPEDILNRENALPENPHRYDGCVKTEDGPATNVEVLLEVTDMRSRRQIGFLRVRTDMNGEFSFDLSQYETSGELGLQFNTSSPRFMSVQKIVRASWNSLPGRLDLEVVPGAVATGKVLDSLGNPIAGAKLIAPGIRESVTKADGQFEVFGLSPESRSELRVVAVGYSDGFLNIPPSPEKLTEGLVIELQRAAPFHGRVLDIAGNPAKGRIYFRTEEAGMNAGLEKDGTFELDGVPMMAEGAQLDMLTEEWLPLKHILTREEATTRSVELQVKPGVIFVGEVHDAAGEGVPNAEVVFTLPGQPGAVGRALADAKGEWTYRAVEPGSKFDAYALPPAAEGQRSMGEFEIMKETSPGNWTGEVDPWPKGHSSKFTITLNGDVVTMKRIDSGRGGQAGEVLYTAKLNPEEGSITGTISVPKTGATGTFVARQYNVTPKSIRGSWDLREEISSGANSFGPSHGTLDAGIFPGRRKAVLTIANGTRLRGRALRADGQPLTQGQVMLSGWRDTNFYRRNAPLKAGGEFEIDGLPEGVVMLKLIDDTGTEVSPLTPAIGGTDDFVIYLVPPEEPPMDTLP